MQSLVPWSHFHEWVKQATADLQRVSTESLTHRHSPRFRDSPTASKNVSTWHRCRPVRQNRRFGSRNWDWTAQGQLDDDAEAAWIATLAERLEQTVWVEGPELELIPYIGGTARWHTSESRRGMDRSSAPTSCAVQQRGSLVLFRRSWGARFVVRT